MFKKILFSLSLITFLIMPFWVLARESAEITDWYIKDFSTEIVVNNDASLLITETIIADCGNLPDKHGIYRTLPEIYFLTENEKVPTPVKLISIKNESGRPYEYSTRPSWSDKTVTWKIGDADKIVRGENIYVIKYKVLNTVRFDNEGFDEFYWNLNGNFWDLEIDNFTANIIFPTQINSDNTEINLYSGKLGEKNRSLARYSWSKGSTIKVGSSKKLTEGEGITISVAFPKNIISKPVLTFWQRYQDLIESLIVIIISMIILGFCLSYWRENGRNPNRDKTIIAHYDVPDKMLPMEFGIFWNNNVFKTSYISSAIVNLAVKGFIKIEEIAKKGVFSSKDVRLILVKQDFSNLSDSQKKLIESLFDKKAEIMISSLKNKFYKKLPAIKKLVTDKNKAEQLFDRKLIVTQGVFILIGIIMLLVSLVLISWVGSLVSSVVWIGCGFTIFLLGIFTNKRTIRGADLFWEAEGFKLYMKTAEKHRQQFYERENIFEKFLPYAMVFGMTKLWASKMKQIYGEEYFNNYRPVWYAGSLVAFDLDSFSNQLDSISRSMSSAMASNPSSSGSGGRGFSGGGGGGGGGGGW